MTPKAVLFDLDGTLVDHFTTIWKCVNYAQRQMGFPLSSYDKVRTTVGGSIHVTMARLTTPQAGPEGVRLFREEFDRIWADDLKMIDGTDWLLERLHAEGLRLAVFTNKQHVGALNVVHHLGLDRFLDRVLGTRDDGARAGWRKPEPRFTEWALAEMECTAAEAAMVGDSPFDNQTGLNAGMETWLVATGSHTRTQLEEVAPGRVYDDLRALGHGVFGLQQ